MNPSTLPPTSRGNAPAGGPTILPGNSRPILPGNSRPILPGNSRRALGFGAQVVATANVKARFKQVEDLSFHLGEPGIRSFTVDFFPLPFGPIFAGPRVVMVRIEPVPKIPPERRSGGRKVADGGIASPEPVCREPEERAPRRTPARRFV